MITSQTWVSGVDDSGSVPRPQPGDLLGPALRGVYGEIPVLPDDMLRLLRIIDHHPGRH